MKTKIITIIFIVIGLFGYSQDYYVLSAEIDSDLGRGVEFKGEFQENWYMGFFAEEFKATEQSFAYGFNLGVLKRYNDFNLLAGVKIGILKDNVSKPIYGINAEINHYFSDCFYVGLKGNLDIYNDVQPKGGSMDEFSVKSRFRPILKFGIIF